MLLFILFSCITCVSSQALGWISEPFNPPNLPLAVKSPYVNCWLPQGPRSSQINGHWPLIWDNLVSDTLVSRTSWSMTEWGTQKIKLSDSLGWPLPDSTILFVDLGLERRYKNRWTSVQPPWDTRCNKPYKRKPEKRLIYAYTYILPLNSWHCWREYDLLQPHWSQSTLIPN